MNRNCPCGNEVPYEKCCQLFHSDIGLITTAQQLMRSRYSAFTFGMGDYLMLSHHSSTRKLTEKHDIVNWAKSVKWERLEVVNTVKGLNGDKEGTVEFKAYFYDKNKLQIIHENSKFIIENEHWVYLGIV